jgi:hypothetical protein
MHDYMSCQAYLQRQHVDLIANYTICGIPEETTYHALVECSITQAFWSKLKELEGIKLLKLCSKTWPEDLLEDNSAKRRIGSPSCVVCGPCGTSEMITTMGNNQLCTL